VKIKWSKRTPTNIDDIFKAIIKKVIKIHNSEPPGGILIFFKRTARNSFIMRKNSSRIQ